MVTHRDVVLALLGASAGLSGLLLVFLGLVVGAYRTLDGATSAKVKKPYRRTGAVLLAAFLVGLACVTAATIWLLQVIGGRVTYVLTVGLFIVQVIALIVATLWTLKELLWD